MAQDKLLWEILVPTNWNDGKPVRTRHHKEWDKVVRKFAGGMTIFTPVKGSWIDPITNDLFKDRLIPVRIACTENQIKQIAKFTIKHYRQLAVFVYVVSTKVLIFNANG
jgi:hypothetical protein